jgi:hypothetical protein
METQNKMEVLKEKAKLVTRNAGKIGIIVIAMAIGFFAGDVYHRINRSEKEKSVPMSKKKIHTLVETSIAINERSELLIIDRQNGEYEIYQDSVGQMIFRLYASQMAVKVTKP